MTGGQYHRHKLGKWFAAAGMDIADWHIVDLRELLQRDPRTDKVGWHEDCTYDNTVCVVMSQPGFVDTIAMLMEMANGTNEVYQGDHNMFVVHCHTGWHRASTEHSFVLELS